MFERFYQYLLKNQVIFALFIIAFGWLLLQVRDVLVSIFISYILMAGLIPAVTFLKKRRLPHLAAVAIAYFGALFFLILLILPLIPFIVSQVQSLFSHFPGYINRAGKIAGFSFEAKQIQTFISTEFTQLSTNAFFVTSQIFGGVFSTITILIVTFYLLLDYERFKKGFAHLFNKSSRTHVVEVMEKIDDKLGAWVRGQVILSIAIAIMSWIVLLLLNVPNALPLALLAGLLEAVPTVGPILASIPALIVALTISPAMTIGVAVAYTLIQFVENNLLVPNIMRRAVGLNPIIVILAITGGATLMGLSGALLAIPFVSFIMVLFNSLENFEN